MLQAPHMQLNTEMLFTLKKTQNISRDYCQIELWCRPTLFEGRDQVDEFVESMMMEQPLGIPG